MKSIALAGAVLVLLAATAQAGDKAVSKSTLTSMGLGSMQLMTDQDGLAVRGQGLIFPSFPGFGGMGGFGGFELPPLEGIPGGSVGGFFTSSFSGITSGIFATINGQLPPEAQIPFPVLSF
jgi:hypothetical protein